MTLKGLTTAELNGAPVKLVMNDNSIKIGTLPGFIASNRNEFTENNFLFCSYTKQDALRKFIEGKESVSIDEINRFVEIIKYSDVKEFEKLENEVNSMELNNNKPIPTGLVVKLEFDGKPGFVRVKYQPPRHTNFFDLGEIQIKNSKIVLPITLSFLSYAKEDRKRVEKIMSKLHDNGILTWYDKRELQPGDAWERKIELAIEKCDYIFIFLSSKSIGRDGYKNKEMRLAIKQAMLKPFGKRYLIPILLDKCQPPHEFSDIQWLEAWGKGWINKLIASVNKFNN